MTVEIVILAMIAAFLGLRLYSVLGRRAEHEEEPIQGRFDNPADHGEATRPPAPQQQTDDVTVLHPGMRKEYPSATPMVERGLREIASADRHFDAFAFMDGARAAYRMILEAFWNGDKEELRHLCDRDVYESFASAIDAREEAGETLENRLVRIEDTAIVAAGYDSPYVRITIRFRSDIAAVTRDADGNVIAGSLDDAIEAIDVWSFARNVTSSDPDWMLDETDEG
ncbi:MAG: Tim44/TimA family putative adaptor protein [Novosphingobium sp.]|nr:Tim44/TimA family putative adaptor protein [Novosphingobium sp.]